MIETDTLGKSFGQLRAVDSVSLCVQQGEIYGFVGPNGAGKTTTIRALLGMVRPSSASWAIFSFILAQIISVLGWGDWIPWSVPVLLSGMYGPQGAEQIGLNSYGLILVAASAGVAATFASWQRTDQVR